VISPRISAVAIGFFIGIIVPFVALMLVGSILAPSKGEEPSRLLGLYTVLWLILGIGGPFSGGFMAARIAKVQPLLHGCIVGLLGSIFVAVVTTPSITGLWSAFVFVPGGITGGWIWKVTRPAVRSNNALEADRES
jgi:hypothetical protein